MSKRGTNGTHMRFEDRRTIDQGRTWFVLQAAPMSEAKAEAELRDDGADVWVPRFHAITIRRKRKVEVVTADTAGQPALTKTKAQELVERGGALRLAAAPAGRD